MKVHIVWNEDRTEGVVFAGSASAEHDAVQCATGDFCGVTSALGEAFAELYEDQGRILETIELSEDA